MNLLQRLKARLGLEGGDRDDLLQDLLLQAVSYAEAYTGRDFLPKGLLDGAVLELAAGAYHRLGIEGEASHTEGGVSMVIDGLPEHLRKILDLYRVAKVGRA